MKKLKYCTISNLRYDSGRDKCQLRTVFRIMGLYIKSGMEQMETEQKKSVLNMETEFSNTERLKKIWNVSHGIIFY